VSKYRGTARGEVIVGLTMAVLAIPLLIVGFSVAGPSRTLGIDTRILALVAAACSIFVIVHGLYRARRERR
jgi:hypothetical protein